MWLLKKCSNLVLCLFLAAAVLSFTLSSASSATDGDNSVTDGDNSATNGDNSATNGDNSATDDNSSATDSDNSATDGDNSVTDGDNSATDDDISATNGVNSATNGVNSATDGVNSATDGDNSPTEGDNSVTDGDNSATDGVIGSANSGPESDSDTVKSRQSRALPTSSFNPYQLYTRLTTAPTLQGFFLTLAGTVFRVIGWISVTVAWTLSGLSEQYGLDEAIDYDYVSRFVTHYTDPQQAGIRIVINFGGQIFGSIILATLASIGSISNDLLSRKKRDVEKDGHAFNYEKLDQDGRAIIEDLKVKDRMDSNCDGTCSLLRNVHFIVDRIFSYPFAIIMLSENLVFLAGKTIFWTILGLLPEPDEIVDSLSAL